MITCKDERISLMAYNENQKGGDVKYASTNIRNFSMFYKTNSQQSMFEMFLQKNPASRPGFNTIQSLWKLSFITSELKYFCFVGLFYQFTVRLQI